MFIRVIAAILAGLGLTVGGLSLHAGAHLSTHAHANATVTGKAYGKAQAGTTAASQTQTATLVGSAAGIQSHGKAGGKVYVVPCAVTQASSGSVTVKPVSMAGWARAGLTGDATLTVPLQVSTGTLGLSVQLSDVSTGSHVLLRVENGVVQSVQLQGTEPAQAGASAQSGTDVGSGD